MGSGDPEINTKALKKKKPNILKYLHVIFNILFGLTDLVLITIDTKYGTSFGIKQRH